MDNSNYTIFTILKFKIEFLDNLEYSLLNYKIDEKAMFNNLNQLYQEYTTGIYHEVVSSLFTSHDLLNKPLTVFFNKYPTDYILKIIKKNKIKKILDYNETLTDCYETFNYIINAFLEEKEIKDKLIKDILDLISISNKHYIYFLFFNVYYRLINNNHSKKITNRMIKILNYCNQKYDFSEYLNDYKDTSKIQNLSNICISLEKERYSILTKIIEIINNDVKKKQNI